MRTPNIKSPCNFAPKSSTLQSETLSSIISPVSAFSPNPRICPRNTTGGLGIHGRYNLNPKPLNPKLFGGLHGPRASGNGGCRSSGFQRLQAYYGFAARQACVPGRSVYQQIEKAGDRGAWSKSLKDQTKLQQHTITKARADVAVLRCVYGYSSYLNYRASLRVVSVRVTYYIGDRKRDSDLESYPYAQTYVVVWLYVLGVHSSCWQPVGGILYHDYNKEPPKAPTLGFGFGLQEVSGFGCSQPLCARAGNQGVAEAAAHKGK